ncbi:nucleotidyltransferase family protein [Halocatena halophila]|uniref:nucleotidyltransferase family protein n=1 Tax=Halocatena halophila TaxID=2814576 RepID=UPI002ED56D4C
MSRDTRAPVGALVLAAGMSQRFGSANKLLATIEGAPIVYHATAIACASSATPVVVVTGAERGAVASAVRSCSVAVRYNHAYASGQASSVSLGAKIARDDGWAGLIYCLGDMPFVAPSTLDRLVDRFRSTDATIVYPEYDGQRANPVLFGERWFDALVSIEGDRGGRQLFNQCDSTAAVPCADSGVVRDIDTPNDLERYCD